MIYYIGIDDTDALNTRGTGFIAGLVAEKLVYDGLGQVLGITRHQLKVSEKILFTSKNNSLCIVLQSKSTDLLQELKVICGALLLKEREKGSNPGLCIANEEALSKAVKKFGVMAKEEVLCKEDAHALSQKNNICLTSHGGNGKGVIGALAAVGLRASGNDGRFVWLKGIREMQGIYSIAQILDISGIRSIKENMGRELGHMNKINVGTSLRPLLINGLPTILVEKENEHNSLWRVVDR